MLRIVENDSILTMAEYCKGDPYGCRIMATYNTYGLGNDFAQFWLQVDEHEKVTAVVGSLDNGLTVCAKGDYDFEEIDLFVEMLAGKNGALRPVRKGEAADGLMMRLDREFLPPSSDEVDIAPPIEDLYSVMERCPGLGFNVPAFEPFYADMLRRTKAGTAMSAVLHRDVLPVSCAAVHLASNVALLTMCATIPTLQGQGCGATCCRALINRIPAETEVYVFCLPGYCGYYEKMGFRVTGGFVY
ncbi:MAG: hypothetical protein E7554_00315 [Ruminococcaceae bacterium]|nr:hypothetical protein [Oscillospiraceae bacterium]